jgi:hypothetical protein
MAKLKFKIEIDEKSVEVLRKQFQAAVSKISPDLAPKTIENFFEQIIESYVKTGEQIKDLGSKFGDIFSKMGDLGDFDLEKLFGSFSGEKKKEEEKTEKPKESNLKN